MNKSASRAFYCGMISVALVSFVCFFAGIKEEKLILVDNLNNILNIVKNKSKGSIYTMVCFDMTAVLKKLLNEGVKK